MKKSTLALVNDLKENNQDFEFYPTTAEIINQVRYCTGEGQSFMDVGAGRGDVLKALQDKAGKLYAIEKSPILINELPKAVFIVGSDFYRQTLIDKAVDVIFSNPPYSEFVQWSEKIIKEACAKKILLVIPTRWSESKPIKAALDSRGATAKILGTYSFENADRSARATVNLVRISLTSAKNENPFRKWFDETFPEPKASEESQQQQTIKETKKTELAKGRNLIEVLEELYLRELQNLIKVFTDISSISPVLLQELGICRTAVVGSLELKIKGLKNRYWNELFENLDKVTDRLTSKSRKSLMDVLFENTHIDFSASNAYAVIVWAIKNANGYIDSQLVDLYTRLSNQESTKAYKSNRHFKDLDWRYMNSGGITHYKLDYRLVNYCRAFDEWDLKWKDRNPRLSNTCKNIINDLCTVGHTLGFDVMERVDSFEWIPGQQQTFYFLNDDMEPEEFAQIRLYKNGNMHIKPNKDFLLRLNIEAARILGWITSAGKAAIELDEPLEKTEEIFNSTYRINIDNTKLLPMAGPLTL